ncbi:hypothetical protein ACFVJK_42775 [Streptomyces sp. NPDC127172]|uniref:hypothetical protein n=1 Tax=Streptomyces sp. NPDC127172 TaxID=3345382 RepID=UPI00363F0C33
MSGQQPLGEFVGRVGGEDEHRGAVQGGGGAGGSAVAGDGKLVLGHAARAADGDDGELADVGSCGQGLQATCICVGAFAVQEEHVEGGCVVFQRLGVHALLVTGVLE